MSHRKHQYVNGEEQAWCRYHRCFHPLSSFYPGRRWDGLRHSCAEAGRHTQRYKRYGLTEDEFLELRRRGNDCCWLCGKPRSEMTRGELLVDHNHRTGKVRGLLCEICNRTMSVIDDLGFDRLLAYESGELLRVADA